jgi:ribosomal protein S18 acetylase RimI-like enzyme
MPDARAAVDPAAVVLAPADGGHAELAARLIHATDPHLFDFWFDRDRALAWRYFADQWPRAGGVFSFVHATAARAGDALLGIEHGLDARAQRAQWAHTLPATKAFLSEHAFAHLLDAFRWMPFVIPPIPDDAYYVQHLAVAPELRGRGVGARLLEHAFARAACGGYRSVQLDVVADGPAARFYRRLGMEVVSETRVPRLEADYAVPAHWRMRKLLAA